VLCIERQKDKDEKSTSEPCGHSRRRENKKRRIKKMSEERMRMMPNNIDRVEERQDERLQKR
jgi:hypothetical protein